MVSKNHEPQSTKTRTDWQGHEAIEMARTGAPVILCKYEDPLEPARVGLTIDEAQEVAREDPSLIYSRWLAGDDA